MATQQVLLLEDISSMGRKGDIVRVKAGFFRNFLLPKKKALRADPNAVRMQQRLQEERAKQAAEDRQEAEQLAKKLTDVVVSTEVKVDASGHMYGSVSAQDIASLLQADGYDFDKKSVALPHPLKKTGVHSVELKLKEGVMASIQVKVIGEGVVEAAEEEATEEDASSASEEEVSEEASE